MGYFTNDNEGEEWNWHKKHILKLKQQQSNKQMQAHQQNRRGKNNDHMYIVVFFLSVVFLKTVLALYCGNGMCMCTILR